MLPGLNQSPRVSHSQEIREFLPSLLLCPVLPQRQPLSQATWSLSLLLSSHTGSFTSLGRGIPGWRCSLCFHRAIPSEILSCPSDATREQGSWGHGPPTELPTQQNCNLIWEKSFPSNLTPFNQLRLWKQKNTLSANKKT